MKDQVKFSWEGSVESEAGVAVYETSTSTYTLRLPNFRSANLVHMALRDVYLEGYEDGVRHTKASVQAALSKLPE
jgi:hypothetical protein